MKGLIYCFENKINKKKYIGQTCNLKKRIKKHLEDAKTSQLLIHKAIRKYGIHNFNIYIY